MSTTVIFRAFAGYIDTLPLGAPTDASVAWAVHELERRHLVPSNLSRSRLTYALQHFPDGGSLPQILHPFQHLATAGVLNNSTLHLRYQVRAGAGFISSSGKLYLHCQILRALTLNHSRRRRLKSTTCSALLSSATMWQVVRVRARSPSPSSPLCRLATRIRLYSYIDHNPRCSRQALTRNELSTRGKCG